MTNLFFAEYLKVEVMISIYNNVYLPWNLRNCISQWNFFPFCLIVYYKLLIYTHLVPLLFQDIKYVDKVIGYAVYHAGVAEYAVVEARAADSAEGDEDLQHFVDEKPIYGEWKVDFYEWWVVNGDKALEGVLWWRDVRGRLEEAKGIICGIWMFFKELH